MLNNLPDWESIVVHKHGDQPGAESYAKPMSSITRDELAATVSAIEERMDGRVERMREETDRRSDMFLRELELRDEAFRREQAIREKALDDRYSGFLAAQAERDKRFDEMVTAIRSDIGRIDGRIDSLGSLKLNIWGAMATALTIGIAVVALSLSFYQTGRGDSQGAASQSVSTAPPAPAKQ
ncbi:hypothetical protein [Stutzerimonas kunmingensis]|uniref:hypothetical protein n=1 Tax=Stutzerimonas kunmingensis TaxID=1211807 RepID=UPI0028A77D51|nr:hypothetical protein [Stutzerimonas kunmingensis]